MVLPDEEAEDCDGNRGEGNGGVTEDALAAEAGDDLGDDSHRGQDHDVDRGVRIEPEEMLEEKRVASERGIEDANVNQPLQGNEDDGDGYDGRSENHDDGCGVV